MLWKLSLLLFFIFYLNHGSFTRTRRITFGHRSYTDKKFMVYLVKSEMSNVEYDNWLCAGAIVSKSFILTSAACLRDVTYLYAIAGYNKYVRSERLNHDNCTRERKQKVVKTCVPTEYNFSYQNFTSWIFLDIGFAIVEKPYNFSDRSYRDYCSFVPAPIKINFHPKYTASGTNGLVYGWGHTFGLRQPGDYQDYNQEYMHETSVAIVEKSLCHEAYKQSINKKVINDYMICTSGFGVFDSEGYPRYEGRRNMQNSTDYLNYIESKKYENSDDHTILNNKTDSGRKGRRQGVCQNDHGAPLVTWIGSYEYVLGVGSTSLLGAKFQCLGPFMYTSTHSASRFIKCAMQLKSSTRKMCEDMGIKEGYVINETEVDWTRTSSRTKE